MAILLKYDGADVNRRKKSAVFLEKTTKNNSAVFFGKTVDFFSVVFQKNSEQKEYNFLSAVHNLNNHIFYLGNFETGAPRRGSLC